MPANVKVVHGAFQPLTAASLLSTGDVGGSSIQDGGASPRTQSDNSDHRDQVEIEHAAERVGRYERAERRATVAPQQSSTVAISHAAKAADGGEAAEATK